MSVIGGKHNNKKARTGGARPGPWWPCLLLVAAAVALTNVPHAALATGPLWNVTNCPALEPYTSGAPTNVSLTVTVNNSASFDQRGGSGCIISGAVTLVFQVEAMRALAVGAGLPNVSIAVQDVVMRTMGGAVPIIQVYVATATTGLAMYRLPLAVFLKNISVSIDSCTISNRNVKFIVFFFALHIPAMSKVLIQDVHLFIPRCVAVDAPISPFTLTAVILDTLLQNSGLNITLSSVSIVQEYSSHGSVQFSIVQGATYPTSIFSGPSSITLSDLHVAVLGGYGPGYGINVKVIDWQDLFIIPQMQLLIQNPSIVIRDVAMGSVQALLAGASRLVMRSDGRLTFRGGDIFIFNLVASRYGVLEVESFTLRSSDRSDMTYTAVVEVDIGRIIVANCTLRGDWSRLSIVPVRMPILILDEASSLIITGTATAPHTTRARAGRFSEILRGVHVLGVQVIGRTPQLRVTAVNGLLFTLHDEATVTVEGVVMNVDNAFVNSITNPAQPVLTVAIMDIVEREWELWKTGGGQLLTLRRCRIVVVRVTAGAIHAAVIHKVDPVYPLTLTGRVTVSDMSLVVGKSTVRGADGVRLHLISVLKGTAITGSSAVLTVSNTCQFVEKILPSNANISMTVVRSVAGQASPLTLTSGGRYVESVKNTLCFPRPTASATVLASRSTTHAATRTELKTRSWTRTSTVERTPSTTPATSKTQLPSATRTATSTKEETETASLPATLTTSNAVQSPSQTTLTSASATPTISALTTKTVMLSATPTEEQTPTASLQATTTTSATFSVTMLPPTETAMHATTRTVDKTDVTPSTAASNSKTKTAKPAASKTPTPRLIEIQETEPPTTSPAPTKPAGQRGDVTATTNTLADRPGALAAVIVCSLIGLIVVVVAIVLWRRRRTHRNFPEKQDKNHATKDAAKDGVWAVPVGSEQTEPVS